MTGLLAFLFICLASTAVITAAIWHAPLIEDDPMEIHLTDEQFDELSSIRLRALSRAERIEAITAEGDADCERACKILKLGADDELSRAYCDDLAHHASHVLPMLGRIARARAGK